MPIKLTGIPPRYGTNNCIDCGKEPPKDEPFWEVFREWTDKKVYSFPICDDCMQEVDIQIEHNIAQKKLEEDK